MWKNSVENAETGMLEEENQTLYKTEKNRIGPAVFYLRGQEEKGALEGLFYRSRRFMTSTLPYNI